MEVAILNSLINLPIPDVCSDAMSHFPTIMIRRINQVKKNTAAQFINLTSQIGIINDIVILDMLNALLTIGKIFNKLEDLIPTNKSFSYKNKTYVFKNQDWIYRFEKCI